MKMSIVKDMGLIVAFALAVGASLSGTASAAPVVFSGEGYALPTGGSAPSGFTGTSGACDLIGSNVKMSTSDKVWGGFACNDATNVMQVAACHQGGSREALSCATYDATANVIAGCSSTAGVSTSAPDFKAFSITSDGGTAAEVALNGKCDSAKLTTLGSNGWVN